MPMCRPRSWLGLTGLTCRPLVKNEVSSRPKAKAKAIGKGSPSAQFVAIGPALAAVVPVTTDAFGVNGDEFVCRFAELAEFGVAFEGFRFVATSVQADNQRQLAVASGIGRGDE